MADDVTRDIESIQIDTENLYKDEVVTDLKVASIRQLSPVKADGTPDPSRSPRFVGQAHIMTRGGPVPINAPIEAESLEDAFKKFPEAVKKAMDEMIEEAQRQQREQSRIITPDQAGGSDIVTP